MMRNENTNSRVDTYIGLLNVLLAGDEPKSHTLILHFSWELQKIYYNCARPFENAHVKRDKLNKAIENNLLASKYFQKAVNFG